ncbi:MAG TPA: hypothetical protein VLA85_19750 [Verrucomicrobiae bacterium]|nr:hypothetical protein [Verrucomicrobiae bacterium]
MKIALRLLSALLITSLLAGCDTPPTRGTFPKLTYAYLTPFRLAVSRVDIVDAYRPPLAAPNVEQSFPVSPSGTAAQWGRDRLIAVGGPDRAVYTVLRGDAIETHLAIPDSGGMFSDFDNPQSERYDLTIGVRLQIIEPDGRVAASVDAKATRSQTVAQDATLNDRERTWFTLTEQTMKDLNASLEKSIPQYLRSYLR